LRFEERQFIVDVEYFLERGPQGIGERHDGYKNKSEGKNSPGHLVLCQKKEFLEGKATNKRKQMADEVFDPICYSMRQNGVIANQVGHKKEQRDEGKKTVGRQRR